MIVYNFTVIMFSWCFKLVTDSLIVHDFKAFRGDILTASVIVLVQAISNYLYIREKNAYIKEQMISIKSRFIRALFNYEISDFEKKDKTDYETFLFNDLNIYEQKVVSGKFDILEKMILMLFSVIAILMINVRFILIVFMMMGCAIIVPLLFGALAQKYGEAVSSSNGQAMDKINEMLNGFTTLRTFSCEYKGVYASDVAIQNSEEAKMKLKSLMAIFQAVLVFMTTCFTLIIFSWGGYSVINNVITVGELIALIQMLFNVAGPIMGITNSYSNIQSAKSIIEKYNYFLAGERKDGDKDFLFNKNIKIQNLSYKYKQDEDYKINDICFAFEKGKKYALVGDNGSGKSTLLKTLAGINDMHEYRGEIKIDGVERRGIKAKEFWNNVSYIPQESYLFKDTLIDNIFMDGHIVIDKAFDSLCQKLDVKRLLENDSYNKAQELSGGERQKIVFIREIMKNTSVIMADEPDSALDIETSNSVKDVLLESDKTCIIVTHKIDCGLKKFDEILVMKGGKLVETGNYDSLIERKGYFYKMCFG